MRFYLGTISGRFVDKPLDRLHVIEILPEELETLQQIPMRNYYEKSQFRYCKYCDKEIEINDTNVFELYPGIYFCREHYQHNEPLTHINPICPQCNQPFIPKTDFYLIDTRKISKSKTTYYQCCTATGNSGHSLRQDYGIISIYLKGVSDGETKTKKLHLRV